MPIDCCRLGQPKWLPSKKFFRRECIQSGALLNKTVSFAQMNSGELRKYNNSVLTRPA